MSRQNGGWPALDKELFQMHLPDVRYQLASFMRPLKPEPEHAPA